jgi:hypothetical protein
MLNLMVRKVITTICVVYVLVYTDGPKAIYIKDKQ